MRKTVAALVAALLFTLAACGASAGEVYDKTHHEGYYKTVMVDDYIWLPKADGTLEQRWVGQHEEQRWVEECYELKFKNDSGDKGDDCVSETTFDNTDLGDWYAKE